MASWIAWSVFFLFIAALIFIDLGITRRTNHKNIVKESLIWTLIWVSTALVFNGYVWWSKGPSSAIDFFTGYIVEKSLSVDNLFVFLFIFKMYKIPIETQQYILKWGILSAIILRGLFIAIGSALLAQFDWIFYLFGVFLIFMAFKIALEKDHTRDYVAGPFLRLCEKVLPIYSQGESHQFFIRRKDKIYVTHLFLALLAIEFSDIIFAIDSIPAIFAITLDPFIVYTSNIFAILGLRSLYLILAHAALRFRYLPYGLAIVLGFVGIKMLLHHYYPISSLASLGVIAVVLITSICLSVLRKANK